MESRSAFAGITIGSSKKPCSSSEARKRFAEEGEAWLLKSCKSADVSAARTETDRLKTKTSAYENIDNLFMAKGVFSNPLQNYNFFLIYTPSFSVNFRLFIYKIVQNAQSVNFSTQKKQRALLF
jgi:hypothetical protein